MKKLLLIAICCAVAGSALAADCNWSVNDGLWSVGSNWSTGHAPTPADGYMNLRRSNAICTLDSTEDIALVNRLLLQYNMTWNITEGGVVGMGWARCGRGSGDNGIINMSGNGSLYMNDDFYIGLEGGSCRITMGDTSSLICPEDGDDGDEVYLGEDGGSGYFKIVGSGVTISVDRIHLTANNAGGTCTLEYEMDASGASAIVAQRSYIGEAGDVALLLSSAAELSQDDIILIQTTTTNGIGGTAQFASMNGGSAAEGAEVLIGSNVYKLTYAYEADADGTLNDVALLFDRTTDYMATEPSPESGSTVAESPVALTWINPEPVAGGPITCTVYFGLVAERDSMDSVVLAPDASAVDITTANFPNYGAQPLDDPNTFYWIVDCVDASADTSDPNSTAADLGRGMPWSFSTDYNEDPIVDAGENQVVWLGMSGTEGLELVILDGTVTDDGAYSVLWTQTSGPAVTINDATSEDATVVVSETGTYVFTITVTDDGGKIASDTTQVVVGSDSCDASKMTGATMNAMDFNADCVVDVLDLLDFASDWLACTNTIEGCL